jgi:hypothetical protein
MRCTNVYCCVLLCDAVYCCVLLCIAVYCCVLQYDEKDSIICTSRYELLSTLHQMVCSMVSHVASSSCFVPELCLPQRSKMLLAGSLSSPATQQVCRLCCNLPLLAPVALISSCRLLVA